jgi:hypothetical protein
MAFLQFMNRGEVEEVRCRVYGADDNGEDERAAFIRELAGPGVIDCPAYDGWVKALQGRGWLPEQPDLEPNPDGPGRIGRWRLTAKGLAETESIRAR